MNKRFLFMALLATGIAMSGCKKEKEQKLEIDPHTPAKDQTYTSPLAVDIHIHGGELIIHDVEAKIFEKANPANVVMDYDNHVEVSDFTIEESVNATVTAPTVFTLKVNVGEDEHATSLTHDFTIKP